MELHLTDEDMIDAGYEPATFVIVVCECGTENRYMQDAPGHRCFDEVYCSNPDCRKVIGKT
jgi:hypothetical protein